ncbi:hypothetical protein [Wenzhouxiangella sediminis]|uniref:Leucine-rich repeat-containing N-terminal plant-type domain-containing protein n=1 Tax=Wenzhouxiangella sediminis TaxID=1792836 RepID=A0A3E1K911_9GAMM|nr:hypothetical protein [Wenzhouxiangella sediminis]RFF30566.1 hypothetical protein DZC52_07495 [Wenzhouxiangella sediminis]
MQRATTIRRLATLAFLLPWALAGAQSEPERDALVALYRATGGENWREQDNWLTDRHHCAWEGVHCRDVDGQRRVDFLDLRWHGLSGQLPESLAGLSELTELVLSDNRLSGPLPDTPWGLPRLRFLAVHDNHFTGTIPQWLLALGKGTGVDLSGNQFSGYRIGTSESGGQTDPVSLDLSDNRLDHLPPPAWLEGKRVTGLDLSDNRLAGSIDMATLPPDLLELDLSDNALAEITGLDQSGSQSLARLDASGNQFESWPAGLAALDLAHLDLGENRLSGSWPEWLSTMPLDTLDLSGNELSGDLPASVGQLELMAIDIGNNDFTGSIAPAFESLRTPDWSGNWLLAADNAFSGGLPDNLEFSRFNNGYWPNTYGDVIEQFGLRGLDLCWNELEISTAEREAIEDAQVHRGRELGSCIDQARHAIDPGVGGSWFDPERSGEGLTQMMLDNGRVMVYWFTYGNLGWRPDEQLWLVGIVEPDEQSFGPIRLAAPEGGRFSFGFNRSARRDYTGSYTIRQDRVDEDESRFFYEFLRGGICITGGCSYEYDSQRLEHDRLTRLAGTTCETQSPYQQYAGAWYNPERAGEGFVVEVLPDDRIVVYWFTYKPDESGHQAWMVGSGRFPDEDLIVDPPPPWETQAEMTLFQPVGAEFGSQFDPADVRRVEWGDFTIRFTDEDHGRVFWNSELDGYGSGDYAIERLATPKLADCGP